MRLVLSTLSLFTCLFVAEEATAASSSNVEGRRTLKANESIGSHVRRAKASKKNNDGDNDYHSSGHFTIKAELSGNNLFGSTTEVSMDVMEAVNPAVTEETIILDGSGRKTPMGGDMLHTLLVSDMSTDDGRETFTLLAIDPETDEVHGYVEKKGSKAMKIKQKMGGKTTAEEEDEELMVASMPDWECGVGKEDDPNRRLERDHHEEHGHTVRCCVMIKEWFIRICFIFLIQTTIHSFAFYSMNTTIITTTTIRQLLFSKISLPLFEEPKSTLSANVVFKQMEATAIKLTSFSRLTIPSSPKQEVVTCNRLSTTSTPWLLRRIQSTRPKSTLTYSSSRL